ncbi:MAG: tail fiber domain-containing protein, partial [Bacteriovoracia bacterium]
NVGIGAAIPTEALDVTGSVKASVGVKAPLLSNATDLTLTADSDNDASGALIFNTGTNERIRVLNNGNVGIGTTNPVQKFEISDSANIRTIVRNTTESTSYMNSIDFVTGTGSLASTNVVGRVGAVITQADPSTLMGDLVFHTNAGDSVVERMRVTGSGNVGIGTTTPSSKLHVDAALNGSPGGLFINAKTRDGAETNVPLIQVDAGIAGGNATAFWVNTSGNVGIGTTTPGSRLDVRGGDINVPFNRIGFNAGTNTGTAGIAATDLAYIYGEHDLDTETSRLVLDITDNTNDSIVLRTHYNGSTPQDTVIVRYGYGFLNAGAWSYASDRRLKENIKPIENGTDVIKRLKPKRFDYISGQKNQDGFIAQEFQKVLPDATSLNPESGILSIQTTAVIPYLVKAFQELNDWVRKKLGNQEKIVKENSRAIASVKEDMLRYEAQGSANADEIARLKEENRQMKEVLCELKPQETFCKGR